MKIWFNLCLFYVDNQFKNFCFLKYKNVHNYYIFVEY